MVHLTDVKRLFLKHDAYTNRTPNIVQYRGPLPLELFVQSPLPLRSLWPFKVGLESWRGFHHLFDLLSTYRRRPKLLGVYPVVVLCPS